MKKEHGVADIANVVVKRLLRIANSVLVKEIEESLHDLRVWSGYTRVDSRHGLKVCVTFLN